MKKIISIALLSLCWGSTYSQKIRSQGNDIRFNSEVKLISEFFDRFNYTEIFKPSSSFNPSRANNLISLIDLKDLSASSKSNCKTFVNDILNDSITINYEDSNWFAICHSQYLYKGKNINIDLMLKLEGNNRIGFNWIIFDVVSNLFSLPSANGNKFIKNPLDDELGFVELSHILSTNTQLRDYTTLSLTKDNLSSYLSYVKNGDIKFKSITSTDYQFINVHGWRFKVKYCDRNLLNSGWLITEITKVEENPRKSYSKNHFNRNSSLKD